MGAIRESVEIHSLQETLALPHSEGDAINAMQVAGEKSAIPEVLGVSEFVRAFLQILPHGLLSFSVETPGTTLPLILVQAGQTVSLKALYPTFDRARILSEYPGDVIAAESVGK